MSNSDFDRLASPARSPSHRRKISLAQYLILNQKLSSPPLDAPNMNRSPQPRQGLAAAGYGQRQQQQQQPQQDHYSQDPAQGQDDQYEEGQFGQEADEEHDGQYALEGEEEHQDGQYGGEDEYQQEGEEENMAADDHRPTGDKKAINGEVKQGNPGKAGQLAKKGAAGQPAKKKGARAVKPQHAHSRFAMDPHHHKMMSTFHRIACKFQPRFCQTRRLVLITSQLRVLLRLISNRLSTSVLLHCPILPNKPA